MGLNVVDLDASVEFYRDKLGFKVIRYQEFGDIASSAFITTGDGEPIVELMQVKLEREGVASVGFSHLGMFVDDVDRIYEESRKAGAKWQGEPARPGPGAPYMGFMLDLDGNRIEVMENVIFGKKENGDMGLRTQVRLMWRAHNYLIAVLIALASWVARGFFGGAQWP